MDTTLEEDYEEYIVLHCCTAEPRLRYVLIIGNVLFFILGLVIGAMAIGAVNQLNQVTDIIPVNLTTIPKAVIVLGVVMLVVSFVACWVATKESTSLLITYSIFIGVLGFVTIILAGDILTFLKRAQKSTEGWIDTSFNYHNLRPAFQAMEAAFRCCGTVGASSYNSTMVPASCCDTPINNQCSADDSFVGCSDRISSQFISYGGKLGWILMTIGFIEWLWTMYIILPYTRRKPRHYASA